MFVTLFFPPGIRSVAFFFSSISAHKKSRGKKGANVDDENSDDSNDELTLTSSQVATNTSQDWITSHPTVINDKLCPCLNYWIALTTPNGAPANPITIHRALLDCGVDTTANQVQKSLFQ